VPQYPQQQSVWMGGDFKHKYLKYKTKYLELKNKNNDNNIY
jgi:hypothetical protein